AAAPAFPTVINDIAVARHRELAAQLIRQAGRGDTYAAGAWLRRLTGTDTDHHVLMRGSAEPGSGAASASAPWVTWWVRMAVVAGAVVAGAAGAGWPGGGRRGRGGAGKLSWASSAALAGRDRAGFGA